MEVRNVRWLGIQTSHYAEMVGLLRDVMKLRTNFEEPTTIEFSTSEATKSRSWHREIRTSTSCRRLGGGGRESSPPTSRAAAGG
jgi:hypothetical protein